MALSAHSIDWVGRAVFDDEDSRAVEVYFTEQKIEWEKPEMWELLLGSHYAVTTLSILWHRRASPSSRFLHASMEQTFLPSEYSIDCLYRSFLSIGF